MDIGVCVASHINDIDYVVKAEALGYSHAWFADSQMLWSDCYAALALAAVRTSTIRLGTGVSVTGTRPASVTAASIATINALAPGRTFLGVGSGNTAMRIMGLAPQRIREYDRYLQSLRPLLRGEEALLAPGTRDIPIRHIMPDKGFVNFADPIPLYVSGFGPRSLALAGQHGDGAVITVTSNPGSMERVWGWIEDGARAAGRKLDRDAFYTAGLTAICVLEPGEAVDSDRVKAHCGPMAMAAVHYAYDQYRNFGQQPKAAIASIWEDYLALIESYPEERRHQRVHAGHNCWVLPEEERFLTPEILRAVNIIGTRDQVIERLQGLEAAGMNQVMILPGFDARFDSLECVAKALIGVV
ncbi:MAG: LLM class flavin-dependent oxidoreductase [Gammaproteobacteria bacterium]|nr:LLM class flavin-dependent oxidoreductase [Gammaproteobacteria bacterium]